MLPTATLTSLLAAFISVASVAAIPTPAATSQNSSLIFERSPPGDLSKRVSKCYPGEGVKTQDLVDLANQLQNQSGDVLDPLKALSWTSWSINSVRVCVYNNYLTDNTHIRHWEVGWAMLQTRNLCCLGEYCGGGQQAGHGDSGLSLNINTMPAGHGC